MGRWYRIYALAPSPARRRLLADEAEEQQLVGIALSNRTQTPPAAKRPESRPPPRSTPPAAKPPTAKPPAPRRPPPSTKPPAARPPVPPRPATNLKPSPPSPAPRRPPAPAPPAPGVDADEILPLTDTLKKLAGFAEEYKKSEEAEDGVWAAAKRGTLDAYLYGENLVDSGNSE